MLNLDIRVLLDQQHATAGSTLTGSIILTPPRASPSTTLESLTLTAKCEVRTSFTDIHNRGHSSIAHPYLITKPLITTPTPISSSTPSVKLRFSLTLPTASQPSPDGWLPSPRFTSSSFPIPASYFNSIHHTLTAEAKTSSKLFSRSKREVPFILLPTRSISSPSASPKIERQLIRSQPASSWRRTLEAVNLIQNPSHSAGFPATAELRVAMPSTLVVGTPLKIRLDPFYTENHRKEAGSGLTLRSFELRLVSRYHVRAKVPKARCLADSEAEETLTEKIELFSCAETGSSSSAGVGRDCDAIMPETPIYAGMGLEDLMEPNLLESAEVMPGFKTANASLRYALELKLVLGVGKGRRSSLTFRRNVDVLAGTYQPAQGVAEGETLAWAAQEGEVEGVLEAPPAYCDPPPEYVRADVGLRAPAMIAV